MKATGIVRRIDELGRVVIPKEIRRTMRIREGDPLEIYTTREGEVIFKKYSLIGGLEDFAAQFCDVLNRSSGFTAAVTDRDAIIAITGSGKRELLGKPLSDALAQVILCYLFSVSRDFIERCLGVLVAHSLESDVPFCAVDAAVVGKEGEFAVALFLATGQDVSTVGWSQTVTFARIGSTENLDALVLVAFLSRVARGAVVEGKADGVEEGRFATSRRTYDAEDGALA